jgi:hypothetical protein
MSGTASNSKRDKREDDTSGTRFNCAVRNQNPTANEPSKKMALAGHYPTAE